MVLLLLTISIKSDLIIAQVIEFFMIELNRHMRSVISRKRTQSDFGLPSPGCVNLFGMSTENFYLKS